MLEADRDTILLLFLILIWSLPWKGVALWKAARRGEMKWFTALFLINSLALLEIFYLFFYIKRKDGEAGAALGDEARRGEFSDDAAPASVALKGFNAKSARRKENAKKEILRKISEDGRIRNRQVEEMLKVSDATATRYLEELEKEGKIEQRGNTGRSVFYTPK